MGACLCSRSRSWVWCVHHMSVGPGCERQVGVKTHDHFQRFGGQVLFLEGFVNERVFYVFPGRSDGQGFPKPYSSVRGDKPRVLRGRLALGTFLRGPKKSPTGDADPKAPPDLSCWMEVSWASCIVTWMCPPSSELQGGCADGPRAQEEVQVRGQSQPAACGSQALVWAREGGASLGRGMRWPPSMVLPEDVLGVGVTGSGGDPDCASQVVKSKLLASRSPGR